jgi:hypothetical protein
VEGSEILSETEAAFRREQENEERERRSNRVLDRRLTLLENATRVDVARLNNVERAQAWQGVQLLLLALACIMLAGVIIRLHPDRFFAREDAGS